MSGGLDAENKSGQHCWECGHFLALNRWCQIHGRSVPNIGHNWCPDYCRLAALGEPAQSKEALL